MKDHGVMRCNASTGCSAMILGPILPSLMIKRRILSPILHAGGDFLTMALTPRIPMPVPSL